MEVGLNVFTDSSLPQKCVHAVNLELRIGILSATSLADHGCPDAADVLLDDIEEHFLTGMLDDGKQIKVTYVAV